MDEHDDGKFVYDFNYPPLCIKPVDDAQLADYKSAMNGAVVSYLQDSHKDGIRPENAILPNGLSAGEAAVLYFRELNSKRRKLNEDSERVHAIISTLIDSLKTHFQLDVHQDRYESVFDSHVSSQLLSGSKPLLKNVTIALKSFLKAINHRPKGYISKLKLVLKDISEEI